MNEAQSAYQGMLPAQIEATAASLIEGEPSLLSRLAILASLVFHTRPELNWVGSYLFDGRDLALGPFQGRPACTRIAWGRGVCGAAAATRQTIVVADVHSFPGHIACDADSRAELVVPMLVGNACWGVFDVDSPRPGRFDDAERVLVERLVARVIDGIVAPDWRMRTSTP